MPEGYYLARELRDEKQKETRLARIEELENEIYERASAVVNAALAFTEVTHDQQEPPQAWIDEYGAEGAMQRLRVARSSWLPPSVAPAGVKLALQAQIGIQRGRGFRVKATQNNLNVVISLPAPTTSEHPGPIAYEVRDLEV